jgi:isopenicillin-N N-acyltransferase-like protein
VGYRSEYALVWKVHASSYPLLEASGPHREPGRRHGEQARAQVRGFIDYLGSSLRLPRDELHARALRFLPLSERHCSHLVDEVRGLAEGAAVPFAAALAAQVRGELTHAQVEGCTTFAVAAGAAACGQVLIGQNSAVEPET